MGHHALMAGYGNPLRIVDGADFDGSTYLNHTTLSPSNGKSGIFSCWVRRDTATADSESIIQQNTLFLGEIYRFRVVLNAGGSNKIHIEGYNSAGTKILELISNSTYSAGATWRHILASWDLNAGAGHLYVNDTNDIAASPVLTNDTIEYSATMGDYPIGGSSAGTYKINGCLSELYFAANQYIDLSKAANRRKFISATGKPVHLGITGGLPTGVDPSSYHHIDDGEAVANFTTSRTGTPYSTNGSLATSSSSPSD